MLEQTLPTFPAYGLTSAHGFPGDDITDGTSSPGVTVKSFQDY